MNQAIDQEQDEFPIQFVEPEQENLARCYHDPNWRYVKADDTDIRRTWAKHGWLPNVRRV